MRRVRPSRPNPALVVAVIALVAALGGTAVAADPVANTAISKKKTKKIANKQAQKVVDQTLPIDSSELASIETRSVSQSVTNNYVELTANCQTDEKVLSGGYKTDNAALASFNLFPFESFKQDEGWYVRAFVSGTFTLTVEAYCLEA